MTGTAYSQISGYPARNHVAHLFIRSVNVNFVCPAPKGMSQVILHPSLKFLGFSSLVCSQFVEL